MSAPLSRILTTQEIGSSSSTRREGTVAALGWWKAPLKKLSCGWPLSGIYEEDCQSSKNGHLHITPETAPRRINSLAEMAGGRIHISATYTGVILALRSKMRAGGTGLPPGPSTREKTSRYSRPSEPMRSVR